ncbi:MAG: PH domain-containing protein [Candidatus Aenigmatarchaeota archaeon]
MIIERTRRAYIKNYFLSFLMLLLFFFILREKLDITFVLGILVFAYVFYSVIYIAEIERKLKTYKIEEDKILIKEGFFNKKAIEIKMNEIGSFNIRKNLFGKILNFGDLFLYTNTKIIVLDKVYKPEDLLNVIKHKTST